jgi:pSer/pThr/pTyr-binding forkhead associated (FHA) protein
MCDVTLEHVRRFPNDDVVATQEIVLERYPFVIGRDENCDFRLDHPYISRVHCCLFLRDGKIWIQDLGSMNGTFLNGCPVFEPRPVRSGDLLCLTFHMFRINIEQSSRPSNIGGANLALAVL